MSAADRLQDIMDEQRQFWRDVEFDRLPRCPECNSDRFTKGNLGDNYSRWTCKACGHQTDPELPEASDAHN